LNIIKMSEKIIEENNIKSILLKYIDWLFKIYFENRIYVILLLFLFVFLLYFYIFSNFLPAIFTYIADIIKNIWLFIDKIIWINFISWNINIYWTKWIMLLYVLYILTIIFKFLFIFTFAFIFKLFLNKSIDLEIIDLNKIKEKTNKFSLSNVIKWFFKWINSFKNVIITLTEFFKRYTLSVLAIILLFLVLIQWYLNKNITLNLINDNKKVEKVIETNNLNNGLKELLEYKKIDNWYISKDHLDIWYSITEKYLKDKDKKEINNNIYNTLYMLYQLSLVVFIFILLWLDVTMYKIIMFNKFEE